MKAIVTIVTLLLAFVQVYAQAPQGINYQGVARDLNGKPISQKEISIRISILNGSVNGEIEYDEIHEVRTNTFGLFTLVIGEGAPGTNSFNFIGWTSGKKWLQVELDENGGRNFKLMGSQQLMSVPYALYAERAGNGYQAGSGIAINNNMITNLGDQDNSPTNELISSVTFGSDNKLRISDAGGTKEADLSSLVGAGQNLASVLVQGNSAGNNSITNLGTPLTPSDAATKSYVDAHSDADASTTNEIQNLSSTVSGTNRTINISGGTGTTIDIGDNDNNATNESQSLSRSGSNLTLTQVSGTGGGVVSIDDADASPTNEAQTLSKSGTTVSLTNVSGSGGGSFVINDDSGTNEAQTLTKVGTTISLSNVSGVGGGSITLNDDSSTNEAQSISRTGSTVTLTQASGAGGGTFSIDDADANATNEAQSISRSGSTVTMTPVGATGGGSFSIDDNDADPANEIQNLSQVLAQNNSAGSSAITNLANPTGLQDAATKSYVDAADVALSARIANTFAFKVNYNHTHNAPTTQVVTIQSEVFDIFGVVSGNRFVAPENGIYQLTVSGTSPLGGIAMQIRVTPLIGPAQFTDVKRQVGYPLATTINYFDSTIAQLNAGDVVELVVDSIIVGEIVTGTFFGYKL